MYCGGNPTCEKCKPKFMICPQCGAKTSIFFATCETCNAALSHEAKVQARRAWAEAKVKE